MPDTSSVIGIVVDPEFGDRVHEVLARMPVWIAGTDANRRVAERVWAARPNTGHTERGSVTVFKVDASDTPESWCKGILGTVAGHHDRYSQDPPYSAIEVFGVRPTPLLKGVFAGYRLTVIGPCAEGFLASTPDGSPALSPNEDEVPDA